ncbi:ABC transporter substrate-binding protein [Romboutsia ilealis]|uniref:ABC transporter substrate-binding protein n=1 Tax=Romboutsia faecis TaxID=2764597 RepID=A0ABR7JLR0_9FIRM|nr:ABC transporter substrate-binding protein [Romboutsia faecis]MBC5995707.1 ABC transporter substrate-binding protein [Romboutsia faecis]MRN23908.1 ABC transporter substrate-binding protein [Romboutsia ilealis]
MKKKKLLAIVLALSMILVGCSLNQENTTSSKENNKSGINSEYINLTMVSPTTINPVLNNDKSVAYIMNLVYDGLFTIDQNYNTVPQLVEEYSIASDGKSINIKLKDAKWHDGKSVTSRDVKFTIELIQKNSDSPYNIFTKNISSVKIENSKEFAISFKEQYAFSKDTLIFPIVSQNILSGKSSDEILTNSNNLIGNGPYKIENMKDRAGMTLVVNKDYYSELPETMRDIKVGIVPSEEDQVSMIIALESDIGRVSLGDLSKFYEDEFNITNYEGRNYESIIFNYDNEYLKDENFRKAITHAIDKKLILEEGYIGNGKLVNFPLNTKSKYYDSDVQALSYDKEKAESYLQKINPLNNKNEFTNEDNKSEVENSNNSLDIKSSENNSDNKTNNDINSQSNDESAGNKELTEKERKELISKVDLKIIANKDNEERIKAANIVSENLDAIGIKSTVVGLTEKEMTTALSQKDYDLAFVGWELSSVPDARSIIQASGYSDEKLTNYMNSLASATSDSQIAEIYSGIQTHLRDKAAFISLVIRNEYIVTNRRLQGKSEPNDFDVYEGISNFTLKNK